MARKTVLVAEDEPDARNIIGTLLRHHGYEVLEAVDGAQAVQMTIDHRPDLVLMDAGLPVLDGWEATTQLKANPDTDAIPVVMVTVHTQEADLLRCDVAGCDSYMAKPCEPASVLAEVQRWIGNS
jgi:two-component system cell cycle response regulator DivK